MIAGALVAVAAGLLAAPDRIVSRRMTWDLLFNLEGAWHLHNGQAAHVDFHDPLGVLNFALTEIGFRLVGVSAQAFITGELMAVAAIFLAAIFVVPRRLPLLPGVLFVVYVCQLVLVPINIGDAVNAFTFAMGYNALGWSLLSVLSLVLFLPPRLDRPAGRVDLAGWLDFATVGALLLALYHIKITYFGAAMAELGVAVAIGPHLRARRWLALGFAMLVHALAPYHWPYLADIFAAVGTGAVNADLVGVAVLLFANAVELSLFGIAVLIAAWLWWSGEAPARLPVGVAVLAVVAFGVLLQNTQENSLVLSVAVALLLYDHFRGGQFRDDGTVRAIPASKWLLLALLILPLADVAKQGASLLAYARQGERDRGLFTFERTSLAGLSVPAGSDGLFDAVTRRAVDYRLFSRIRAVCRPTARN